MIAFINEHRDIYGVEPICKVLPIAPSTYRLHAARQRDPSLLPDRARRDLVLMEEIGKRLACPILLRNPVFGLTVRHGNEPWRIDRDDGFWIDRGRRRWG